MIRRVLLVSVGAVLVAAALAKAFDPEAAWPAFEAVKTPSAAVPFAVVVLVVLEAWLGASLLVESTPRLARLLGMGMMTVFTLVLGWLLLLPEPIPCGCFGRPDLLADPRQDLLAGIGRNLCMLGALAWTGPGGPRDVPRGRPSFSSPNDEPPRRATRLP